MPFGTLDVNFTKDNSTEAFPDDSIAVHGHALLSVFRSHQLDAAHHRALVVRAVRLDFRRSGRGAETPGVLLPVAGILAPVIRRQLRLGATGPQRLVIKFDH